MYTGRLGLLWNLGATAILLSFVECEIKRDQVGERCPLVGFGPQIACSESMECPAGATCATSGYCEAVYFTPGGESQLLDGFEAPEMELRSETRSDGTTEYSVRVPDTAEQIVCGVFVAEPVVSGGIVGRIVNSWKSLHRIHVFDVSSNADADEPYSLRFLLSDLDDDYQAAGRANCDLGTPLNKLSDQSYPLVTMLRLGCWAYGPLEVVGATRLRDIPIGDLPELQPLMTDCFSDGEVNLEGRYCQPREELGYCDGICRPLSSASGAGASGGAAGAAPVTSTAPLRSCDGLSNGETCVLDPEFKVGRCIGNRCAHVDVVTPELPLVVDDCNIAVGDTDWLNCFEPKVQGYGTCYERECRWRCTTSCEAANRASDEELECAHVGADGEHSFVGVCLPAAVRGAEFCVLNEEGACL